MLSRHIQFFALLASLAVLAAGCSSGTEPGDAMTATTTTAPPPITTVAPTTTAAPKATTTTTTTPEPAFVAASGSINGLPAEADLIDRRVVAVKIDNHLLARPQFGLETADAVFEVLVESGLTRFIALFHQSDLEHVGPNRSGRVTDSKVIAALGGAPFQISGAQSWVKDVYVADRVNVVYDTGATTFRSHNRPKPHNLFTSTVLLRSWADDRGWPDVNPGNLFAYGEPTPGDAAATRIEISFSAAPPSTWVWDGEQYLRYHGSTPHEWVNQDGDSGQVAFATLVVMKMLKYTAHDPAGSGTSLPTVRTVGRGEAFVFFNGEVVGGMWERGSIRDPFFLTTLDGVEIVLPPGRVWISLVPDNRTITWE